YPNLKQEFSSTPFKRGVVGMARRGDSVDSANAQFFICFADASFLNNQYTVIGDVVQGMDVVDKLKKAPPGSAGGAVSDPDQMVKEKAASDMKEPRAARRENPSLWLGAALLCLPRPAAAEPLDSIKDVIVRLQQCWQPPRSVTKPVDITVIVSFNREGAIL